MLREIISYFAAKHMGSVYLNMVDVIWEQLDGIEKEMVRTLKEAKGGNLIIKSRLNQAALDAELAATPFIIV